MTLTMKSKVKELYATPIGKDVFDKVLLQVNKSSKWLLNPIVGNLSLAAIKKISFNKLDQKFFDKILFLLNSEKDLPLNDEVPIEQTWWKEAIFYQIYPRSFKDSNGDGVGDLRGIIEKLDYLQELGITALWLSPIYQSPNDDNGYDISDYQAILAEFGTMTDFDELLAQLHKRSMRLIMDLVVNHTSDEHPWFQKALADENSPYRNYYFFEDGTPDTPPNNWKSFFSGPAWRYFPKQKKWVMHLFTKKQMDLNWDYPAVREEVAQMVRWWLAKGVDGFRLDVINYISKNPGLKDGDAFVGELMEFYGIEEYYYGIHLHEYLHELKENAFAPFDAFSVGETPGVGIEMAKLLTGDYRKELDMVFNFDQLETPGHVRFDDYRYDLNFLKEYLMNYQTNYGNHYWMSLFYENHDNPHMISKVNPDPFYREVLGKLLGTIQMTLKGTPFIFQGQELGLINKNYQKISDFKDVETLNKYQELLASGQSETAALKTILAGSRDHARAPMPWNNSSNGGFTTGTPWLLNDEDYLLVNVENQEENPNSVWHFYQKLIALRKEFATLIYGAIEFIEPASKNYFSYIRKDDAAAFLIEINLGTEPLKSPQKNVGQLILGNYTETNQQTLQAYEARIYKIK
ncbi:alpha-glucosidase [Enterococcus timonensis]|uniref:alpha-glucosidase n=1 Tax=Enterococcus timonensis TaxID=1852364 RepID=UPI0009F16D1F|nr:alpha-glucosidase [Enterococcus timonensis]